MDRVTVVRHCSSSVKMCDNESLSRMNYLIRLMMSVRRIQTQIVGSSTNSQDPIVGVDCNAVDRVWALYKYE